MIATVLLALAATAVTATPALAQGGSTVTPSGWCCRG
jgi:hypothetical protein